MEAREPRRRRSIEEALRRTFAAALKEGRRVTPVAASAALSPSLAHAAARCNATAPPTAAHAAAAAAAAAAAEEGAAAAAGAARESGCGGGGGCTDWLLLLARRSHGGRGRAAAAACETSSSLPVADGSGDDGSEQTITAKPTEEAPAVRGSAMTREATPAARSAAQSCIERCDTREKSKSTQRQRFCFDVATSQNHARV